LKGVTTEMEWKSNKTGQVRKGGFIRRFGPG